MTRKKNSVGVCGGDYGFGRCVMFRNTFISGFISLFFAEGNKPLQLWRVICSKEKGADGSASAWVKVVQDEELGAPVLELIDDNVATTRIECPANAQETLAISNMPYLVLIVKNLKAYLSVELEVVDDSQQTRRFRCSNFQMETRVKENICTMPLLLESDWNTLTLDLRKLCFKAYGTQFKEFSGLTVHASTRIRRIYLAQELIAEENLPTEFKLFK